MSACSIPFPSALHDAWNVAYCDLMLKTRPNSVERIWIIDNEQLLQNLFVAGRESIFSALEGV